MIWLLLRQKLQMNLLQPIYYLLCKLMSKLFNFLMYTHDTTVCYSFKKIFT